ncbi:MAG TPA: TPM domain-containing protein, partial [Caldimonas sp.]
MFAPRRPTFAMRALLAAAAMLGALGLGPALAEDVVPVPLLTGRVIDQTGTLTSAQADALSTKLAKVEQERGAQIVILIVPTARPEDIASFAQRVASSWKLGRKEVGDGLLLTVAKNDRDVNIQVAATLQGAIPDVVAGRLIREQIGPAFQAGDFAGGLNRAVDSIAALVAGEKLPPPRAETGAKRAPSLRGFDWQDLAIFLFVAVPIVGRLLGSIMGRKLGALATGAAVGAVGWWLTASLLAALGAGIVALFLVGVMGFGTRGGGFGGPVIWGG